VKLRELEINNGDARANRHRETVRGRSKWVRRSRPELAHPAGGDNNYRRFKAHKSLVLTEVDGKAGNSVSVNHEVDGKRLVEDVDVVPVADRGDERAFDFGARGIASGMKHPATAMRCFASEQ
jgi:hypothetical protein